MTLHKQLQSILKAYKAQSPNFIQARIVSHLEDACELSALCDDQSEMTINRKEGYWERQVSKPGIGSRPKPAPMSAIK